MPKQNQEIPGNLKKTIVVINLKTLGHIKLYQLWERRAPKMMKIRLIKSRKSWIWDQYLSKTMKRKFGQM